MKEEEEEKDPGSGQHFAAVPLERWLLGDFLLQAGQQAH